MSTLVAVIFFAVVFFVFARPLWPGVFDKNDRGDT
jgi:hypothetical protein